MLHLGTWLSGGHGSAGLTVELDFKGLFQPKCSSGSISCLNHAACTKQTATAPSVKDVTFPTAKHSAQ